MKPYGHLWAIGYDIATRAGEVRDAIAGFAWGPHGPSDPLILLDMAMVVRQLDGSLSLTRAPRHSAKYILICALVWMLAGLVVSAPVTGAAVGALVGGAGAMAATAGIDEDFVKDIGRLMRPGTSALFVLDDGGDMEVILHHIRGLGLMKGRARPPQYPTRT